MAPKYHLAMQWLVGEDLGSCCPETDFGVAP
jgi:hypothetical protein